MKRYILSLLITSITLLVTAQQQLPNPSFENWTTNPLLPHAEPDTWYGSIEDCIITTNNILVCTTSTIQTTDAQSGIYAAKLVNIAGPQYLGDLLTGQLIYTYNTGIPGYTGYTDRPNSLTGYYKFNKTGSDKVTINVGTFNSGDKNTTICWGILDLTESKTDYTLFTVPLNYSFQPTLEPTDIFVGIYFNENASIDSDFTIDNLVFTYSTTASIVNATPSAASIQFFPNPAKGEIHFGQSVKNISIQTANGSMVLSHTGDTDMLNISTLENGIYIISYEHNDTRIHSKLIVEN